MALLDTRSGCKVGWDTYDDETEAKAAAEAARVEAARKWNLGYDFGYQVPGGITFSPNHKTWGKDVWIVTVP